MMRTPLGHRGRATLSLCAILLPAFLSSAHGTILTVPQVHQQQTNWCWAASSDAILQYTGNSPGQCPIVNWARTQLNWGSDDCCATPSTTVCNHANALNGTGSAQAVLQHWGADSKYEGHALSIDEVREAMDAGGPVMIAWARIGGGTGHAVVLYGETNGNVNIMDPWSGSSVRTYQSTVNTGTHVWRQSLKVTPKRVAFVIDDTGSMSDDIDSVRNNLLNRIDAFKAAGTFVDYFLITYKDYVTYRGHTTNPITIRSWVSALTASAGGDCPEEGYGALDTAAQQAKQSEIWWMTDADSHGGFIRMLQTAARLMLAHCKLHSLILPPTCYGSDACAEQGGDSQTITTRRVHGDGANAASPVSVNDVPSYEAAEYLSQSTGGLFFATSSSDVDDATEMILEQITATADLARINLASGTHTLQVPVDFTSGELRVLIDVGMLATGSIVLCDPSGLPVSPGVPGVRVITAGTSQMILVSRPALLTGTYTATVVSDHNFVFASSTDSDYFVELLSGTTTGVGRPLNVQLLVRNFNEAGEPLGPGDQGPGGFNPVPPPGWRGDEFPFPPASLQFYSVRDDGSGETPLSLFDNGLHNDRLPNDGVYGGTVVFDQAGRYRVGAKAGNNYEREAVPLLVAGSLAIDSPVDVVVRPGDVVVHRFVITNLGTLADTYDLSFASSRGWAALAGLPASLVLGPGGSQIIDVTVTAPVGALPGSFDSFSLAVASASDPTTNGSGSVQTLVRTGPIVSSVVASVVHPGDPITIRGTGFGADPGPGNRSSDSYNIQIAGVRFAESHITLWSDTQILATVPSTATSGLLVVTAASQPSNSVEIVVAPRPYELIGINNVDQGRGTDQMVLISSSSTGVGSLVGSLGSGFAESEAVAVQPGTGRVFVADDDRLLELDPSTGSGSLIGVIGFAHVDGLAFQLETGVLYGVTYGNNQIIRIDTATGAGSLVASHVLEGHRLNDLAFHPDGRAFIITDDSPPKLYQVDILTGEKIQRWILSGGTSLEALTWSPDGGALYSAADRDGYKDLVTIDLTTSAIAFVSADHSGYEDIESLAWANSHLAATLRTGWAPTDVLREEPLPTTVRLWQNAPNPFNPSTRIEFELPTLSRVDLSIYDVAGHKVATLYRGETGAGHHSVTWSGRSDSGDLVAAGVYECVLSGLRWSQTKRMVLVK